MTWLNELIEQHSELEPPKAFWYWAGLCAISAVVKDNVYLSAGGAWNVYPNIYVMLYADSGLRKGAPIALAHDLVRRVDNTRIISGRSSIQGILKELGTSQTEPGGKARGGATGFIVASEFSSSLVHDPASMVILTDLYDRNWNSDSWGSLLKMEKFKLTKPTITLLAGINEAHFNDFIESKDVHGGFIGRTFLIAENKVHRLNPLIKKLKIIPDREYLAKYLLKLSELTGEFESLEDTEAGDLYEQWYIDLFTTVEKQRIPDKTGTIRRVGDSVKKVAMLLSLSESPDLVISLNHVKEAIAVCEKLIGNVRRTTYGKQELSSNANKKTVVLMEFLQRETPEITRKILYKKLWMQFDSVEEFDVLMHDYHEGGLILTSNQGNQVVYKMPDEIRENYRKQLGDM